MWNILWKCCTQYASKLGKLSSGHRTGKCQFSFQSLRKAMSKKAQSTAQVHSSHTLAGEGNGTPLQYSCLENPMDRGAWKASVHGVAEGQTQLSDFTFTFHFHALEKKMATDSSVLAWRIPETGESGGLPSTGLHRVRHDWSDLTAAAAHASKVMLKILQARLQQSVNRELPGDQVGFRKGRGSIDRIANILWNSEKARKLQRNIYFCFIDYAKAFDCVDHKKNVENSERDRNTRPPDLPPEKSMCRSRSNS